MPVLSKSGESQQCGSLCLLLKMGDRERHSGGSETAELGFSILQSVKAVKCSGLWDFFFYDCRQVMVLKNKNVR